MGATEGEPEGEPEGEFFESGCCAKAGLAIASTDSSKAAVGLSAVAERHDEVIGRIIRRRE